MTTATLERSSKAERSTRTTHEPKAKPVKSAHPKPTIQNFEVVGKESPYPREGIYAYRGVGLNRSVMCGAAFPENPDGRYGLFMFEISAQGPAMARKGLAQSRDKAIQWLRNQTEAMDIFEVRKV